MLTTSDGAAARQARQEGAEHPDAAEVVDPDQPLDHLGVAVEEARPSRDPRVVDEHVDPRVPLEHARGDGLDGGAVGDIARLRLAAQLLGERLEAVGASREQDAEVAARREQARDLGADARRGARDDSDPAHAREATPLGSRYGWIVRRQAGPRPRRRQQALDRVGDRARARGRRCEPRLHLPGRSHRVDGARPGRLGRLPARHGVRRPLRRGRRARLRRGGGRVRRRARPARPFRRLRRRRGSRRALHRHPARPLLARRRRERLLARRLRAGGRAADGEGRRRLDRDDDLPRRRARRAALQRHGRRQGDPRRVRALPRLGSRPRRTSA